MVNPQQGFPRRFGPYVLVKPLARGGMGALYLALHGHPGMEKLCVVKTALPHLADRGYLQRFRDEAKVVVRLSHGNLVHVFNAGEISRELFLAMDFIEGKDLRAVWNRCAQKGVAFPIAVAAHIVRELTRGLAYAHAFEGLSLVHRDVSPPNVLLSYSGEVKLTDFGLATSTLKLEKTAPGVIYGKVSYMSPEQARGEPLDRRTDLYAAGVILWELLTGRQLFPPGGGRAGPPGGGGVGIGSDDDLLERVRSPKVVAPSTRAGRVPPELDAICARALSPDAASRYQNGEELRSDLAAYLAKTAPAIDGEQVARFLRDLFGDDIDKERVNRTQLVESARPLLAAATAGAAAGASGKGGVIDESRPRAPVVEKAAAVAVLASVAGQRPANGAAGAAKPPGVVAAAGPTAAAVAAPGPGPAAPPGVDSAAGTSPRAANQNGGHHYGGAREEVAPAIARPHGMTPRPPAVAAAPALAPPPSSTLEDRPHEENSQIVGSILADRYHIKRLCGEGGMGRVYEAEHVEIGKRVAVKVLHPAYTRTPDVVERFRREARAASKIYHPNVVNVTDSGTTGDGAFFFVMEYIEGVELGFVIHREGPLPAVRALPIAEQMCEALQAAHDVGVIHRDLKPENILLVTLGGSRGNPAGSGTPPDGASSPGSAVPDFVKVLDFGIAKSAEMEESAKAGRRLTRPGMAMGTPEYMAPEQAAGKPADPRSDIYAVGSIVYEMLTGVPPYDGDNVMEVLHKKANEAPRPLAELRPDVPASVQALVERAMARSPEARPQSMRQLADELRVVIAALRAAQPLPPPVTRTPSGQRESVFAGMIDPSSALAALGGRRGVVVTGGAALLVMLTGFVIVRAAVSRRPTAAPAATATAPAPSSAGRQARAPTPPPAPPVAALPPPASAPAPGDGDGPSTEPATGGRNTRGTRGTAAPGLGAGATRELLASAQRLLKAQRYDEAREAFNRLLAARRERGKALLGLANIAFQQKKYGEAVQHARDATRASTGAGAVDAHLLLGDAYFKLEKFGEARDAYSEALRRDPNNPTATRALERASRRIN